MRNVVLLAVLGGAISAQASAQVTANPSFNAPYRAFSDREYGISVSFPGGADASFEGVYRLAQGNFDIGFRAGVVLDVSPANHDLFVFGTEFRQRVITHTEDFPADGAVIFGVGARLGNTNQLILPLGLSLGRRLDVEDSDVSIVPFLQPTAFVMAGDGNDDFGFAVGFGADFQLTRTFDFRLSAGLGDIDGISLSAVWVR